MLCFFERGNGHLARNRRISFEKLFESVPPFDRVEQQLQGHARYPEDWRSAKDLRISYDNTFHTLIRFFKVYHPLPGLADGAILALAFE